MAPFVGLGSTMLVPSLLKALPALKASTISDSRMDIAELCGVDFGGQVERDRLRDASVMTSKSARSTCYNAIWRLFYWWWSDLGRTFTARRRRRPWNGQRDHEKGTSHQVSLNLSNVLLSAYLLAQGNFGFTRGSQGYAFTTYTQFIMVEKSPICDTAMLAKVQAVQKEVDKLTSGNETLQMYIDNLTVQMAKRR